MPPWAKRNRVVIGILAAFVLLAAGVGMRWGPARYFPGLVEQARAAYSRGDWQAASTLAGRRLKDTPEDPEALRIAARSAARQDRDQAAATIYTRRNVGTRTPEDDFLLGRALSRIGQADAALEAFESALKGNPDDPEILDFLCRLYYQKDRYYASQGAALKLANHPAWEAKAQLMLALARAELEDPAGVANALGRWLELDPQGLSAAPDPPRTYQILLARSLLKARRPAEARTLLETLLKTGPDPEASWLLSRSWLQEKNVPRAESIVKRSPSYKLDHPSASEPAPYVGEARCATCHANETQSVLASRHATTFARGRDLDPRLLSGKPLPDPGDSQVVHRFESVGQTSRLETQTTLTVYRAVIDYAFGSLDHFMTMVGHDDRGQSFMIRMSAYTSKGAVAWDVATALPLHPTVDLDYLGTRLDPRDGERRCLFCHTTNFRSVQDAAGPESVDHAIGCEKCHGPGGHHLVAVQAGFSDAAIGNPRKGSPAAVNQVCGQCHGFPSSDLLSTPRTDPALYRFQSVAMTWSRCYLESDGILSCVTCHDPHQNAENNQRLNEAKCLACHAKPAAKPPAATAREPLGRARTPCPVNPTQGCLACHMPRMWQKDTHSFKTDHYIRVREKSP